MNSIFGLLLSKGYAEHAISVRDVADQIGKTVRGVKTMLTRRGLQCSDYNGAAKKDIG